MVRLAQVIYCRGPAFEGGAFFDGSLMGLVEIKELSKEYRVGEVVVSALQRISLEIDEKAFDCEGIPFRPAICSIPQVRMGLPK